MQTLTPGCGVLQLNLNYDAEGPLLPVVQAHSSLLPPLFNVENSLIFTGYTDSQAESELNAEDTLWLDVFHSFSAVKRRLWRLAY